MEAEVMFEYEKTQDDELDLKVGMIIRNVKEVDDGWCEGDVDGKRGMFPDNFVKLRPASAPSQPPSQPPPASEPPSASVPLRNIDASKKIRRAKVTFSYAADNGDELTLQPGQVVEVLEEEEEGWWKGRIGNNEGVFPSNFVEEILEEEVKTQPVHPPAHHQPAHQPAHQPSSEAVDSQTGERGAPEKSAGIRGPKVMPAFDPTKARLGLKKASVAPPLEKPPEHKKPPTTSQSHLPPKHPEKVVEQAKVTFEYEADNNDELTIKVGEIVEIVSKDVDQDGWWEVSLKGRKGLIPNNFVELLPPPSPPVSHPPPPSKDEPPKQAPAKPPPPKDSQPVHPPPPFATKKKSEPKKFPPAPVAKSETKPESTEDQTDFAGVPKTTPLNSQVIKERPKHKNRPPSRSNLLANHEPLVENPPEEPSPAVGSTSAEPAGLSPWQAELKAKKKQPPKLPKPAAKAKPPATVSKPDPPPVARSRINTGSKDVQLPPAKTTPTPKPTLVKLAQPAQPKPVETKPPPPQDTPTQSEPPSVSSSTSAAAIAAVNTTSPKTVPAATAATPTVVADNSWKVAYEKLREDFDRFKEHMIKEIGILTDDLDKERKHRAGMDIDIDRLKKAQRSLGH